MMTFNKHIQHPIPDKKLRLLNKIRDMSLMGKTMMGPVIGLIDQSQQCRIGIDQTAPISDFATVHLNTELLQ